MGVRDCRRKSVSFAREVLPVNKSYLTCGFRQVVTDGIDQCIVMGKNQCTIRADEVSFSDRKNNFYFYQSEIPFTPRVVRFDT